ncbi:MAG: integrin alpha, partial [Candidatus Eiseniibacteriota bacterium]
MRAHKGHRAHRDVSGHIRLRQRAARITFLVAFILVSLLLATTPHGERETRAIRPAGRALLPGAPHAALAVAAPKAAAPAVGVSADWWAEVSRRLAASEYNVSSSDLGLQAPNRAQNLRTVFNGRGVEIGPRDPRLAEWHWSWSLERWGREGDLESVPVTEPIHEARRVEYVRDGITEWYENTEAGLEQGFTIPESPPGDGPLCIEGALTGNLRPAWRDEENAIVFLDEHDAMVLRYGKLLAWDAGGRELDAAIDLLGSGIRLAIDDHDALYPVTVDPLMDTPDWSVDGYQEHTPFGISVATAGDVNGDGYSDVIASSPRYASGGPARGRAWLYLGGPGGLETEWVWYGYGEQDYAIYGTSVAPAGDVNGDGYDDVVVGQPSYDGSSQNIGRAYVYYGSPTGLPWDADRVLDGHAAEQFFGNSVATAGDVNGDGYADVIIGTDGNFAYVYHGSAAGLEAGWSWRHQRPGKFGFCVGTAGDVDGDGYDDVIVGAPADNSGGLYGRALVFLGSASGLLDDPDWETGETAYAHYGYCVATAGDVTGDGYSDVLVGAHSYSGDIDLEGRAYLYEGSASGLSLSPSWTDEGGENNSAYGWCVATAGDINADGYSDILVTAKEYNGDYVDQGRVYLYMGHDDGLSADPDWHYDGEQDEAWCGWSAASAGDVNGDGLGDVIVGIPDLLVGGDEIGRVVAFYGGRAGPRTEAGWVTESNQTDARYGATLASVGDVNGDGYGDVLVGAPGYDYGQVDEGAVFLFLG